jgi:glycosyltransferase involved in cell wall biosynthesis
MNIIHYVRKLHPSEGGTFTLATTLNKYLLKNKHKSMVVSDHYILLKNLYKCDLIHFHGIWNIYSSIFITLCKVFKKPYFISTHGMLNSWSLKKNTLIKNIYFKLIEKDNLEKADYVHFLNSQELKDSKFFNLRIKNFLVPNAIDDDHLKNKLSNNNLIRGLFLGRITKKKNIELIINTISKLSHRNFTIDIMGPIEDINYYNKLRGEIKNKNLDKFIFFKKPLYKKETIFKKYDFFLLTSLQEGDPYAVKEAMSMSLPPIVSIDSRANYLSNSVNGYIFKNQNELYKILENKINKKLLSEIGKNAYKFIKKNYLMSKKINNFIYFYNKVINDKDNRI